MFWVFGLSVWGISIFIWYVGAKPRRCKLKHCCIVKSTWFMTHHTDQLTAQASLFFITLGVMCSSATPSRVYFYIVPLKYWWSPTPLLLLCALRKAITEEQYAQMLIIILIPGEEAARCRNNLADIQPTRDGIVLQQQRWQLIIYRIVLDSNYLIKPLPHIAAENTAGHVLFTRDSVYIGI